MPLDSFSFRTSEDSAKLVACPEGFIEAHEVWDFRCFEFGTDYSAAVSLSAPIKSLRLMESIPLVGTAAIDDPRALCSHSRQDALAAAFC